MSKTIDSIINSYHQFWFGLNDVYDQWVKEHHLTVNTLFTLYAIHSAPAGCTQRMICEQLLLPKQTVNTLLNGLEQQGYLQRIPDEKDKRSKQVRLTAAGQQYTDRLLAELHDWECRALGQMEPEHRETLISTSLLFLQQLRLAAASGSEQALAAGKE